MRLIELTEYEPLDLAYDQIQKTEAEAMERAAAGKVSVDGPAPRNNWQWRLTSAGYVGFIPVQPDLGLNIKPRVKLGNLFQMLEYAYNLKSFEFFQGLVHCASLQDFYERLASVLAKRVLDRSRRGLYRSYLEWEERLPCVRGRIDVRAALARPWESAMPCHFEEHTADLEENQILLRTLATIARSGICSDRVLPVVRQAYRTLGGLVSDQPLSSADCLGRLYHRLNEDYRPMHALCRFFLEHAGPAYHPGQHEMIPFVVHMPNLFEAFVAEWLRQHLPPSLMLSPQYTLTFGGNHEFAIRIDLLVTDAATGKALWVLDTKYKTASQPSSDDIEQVVAYAAAKNCTRAGLIYPQPLTKALHSYFGESGVQVKTMVFDLSRDLEQEGQRLVAQLQTLDFSTQP